MMRETVMIKILKQINRMILNKQVIYKKMDNKRIWHKIPRLCPKILRQHFKILRRCLCPKIRRLQPKILKLLPKIWRLYHKIQKLRLKMIPSQTNREKLKQTPINKLIMLQKAHRRIKLMVLFKKTQRRRKLMAQLNKNLMLILN